MKFLVFNIAVVGALVYLIAGADDGTVTVPGFSELTGKAQQALGRISDDTPQDKPIRPPARQPVARKVPPEPALPAPAPAEQPLTASGLAPSLPPDVVQRRADVLAVSKAPTQAVSNRRQQLLDIAEEMEFLAAEFAAR